MRIVAQIMMAQTHKLKAKVLLLFVNLLKIAWETISEESGVMAFSRWTFKLIFLFNEAIQYLDLLHSIWSKMIEVVW